MTRKAARVLVWLALAACLVWDFNQLEPLFSRLTAPFAEPLPLWEWLTLGACVLAQSSLVWAELRLRPKQTMPSLKW